MYDKTAESDGKIDATRWELELRDDAARVALDALPVTQNWGVLFGSMLLSFVDFRARWQASNVTECEQMAWFAALVEGAMEWEPYPPGERRTLASVRAWVERQVGPSLAMLFEAFGAHEVLDLVLRSRGRLRREHWRLLREAAA